MAWRFPVVLPISGDVLHPSHWNSNIDVYSSELNGFVDGDNIESDSISSSMTNRNAFVAVYSSTFDDEATAGGEPVDDFDVNMKTTAWHDKDVSETPDKMPSVEFTADTDGWVQCDFHAGYEWKVPSDPSGGSQAWFAYGEDTSIWWHSDGVPPDPFSPKLFADMGFAPDSDAARDDWDAFAKKWRDRACDPLWIFPPAVPYTSPAADPSPGDADEAPVDGHGLYYSACELNEKGGFQGRFFNGGLVEDPSDSDAIAFRMLVDGITVAETGWMSIGLFRNGTSLTGVAPVSAGEHTVQTQVRAARIGKMQTTTDGLRSAGELTLVNPVAHSVARTPNTGGSVRVRGRGLTVIFRKR